MPAQLEELIEDNNKEENKEIDTTTTITELVDVVTYNSRTGEKKEMK